MGLHTFAVCAYQDSPYLEACIRSLKAQRAPSDIIVCTSTPSPYIDRVAGRYGIPVYVRDGKSSLRDDWNFAYHMAEGEYVTIAHQDDLYHKNYVGELSKALRRYPDMSLFTTGYVVVKDRKIKAFEKVEFIKRILRTPLRLRRLSHLKLLKKSIFLFGNPICCPACAYHKKALGELLFSSEYRFAIDWDTLYQLAGRPGRFICAEKPLLYYRVHEGATTKACIRDNSRASEEAEMFGKIWPDPMARLLMRFYRKAYEEYEMSETEEKR